MADEAGTQTQPVTGAATDPFAEESANTDAPATVVPPRAPSPESAEAQSLMAALAAAPYGFDFHQAVRRLESAHPDKPRVGTSDHTYEDPVRFGQDPSLAFAPASLSSVTHRPDGAPRMGVAFLGLMGPNGPLPLHLTSYARERVLSFKDRAFVNFLDLLTHRFICLFHRAWAVNQKTVSYDRPQTDRWTTYFGSLAGLGIASLRNRDRVPDLAKLYYSGRLAPHVKSAAGLRDVLSDYLRVVVTIKEFVGQWVNLPEDCCCRLGESPATGQLGRTAIVGSRIWDCQMKFRVRLGPLPLADFERFLPGRPALRRLHDWVQLYTGGELDWDVQLILRKEEVPPIRLGQSGRVGWTTWIGTQPHTKDPEEVILSSTTAAA
jgi:type VI secretion system protein ImpH